MTTAPQQPGDRIVALSRTRTVRMLALLQATLILLTTASLVTLTSTAWPLALTAALAFSIAINTALAPFTRPRVRQSLPR